MLWDAGFWIWQVQVVVFLALALVCAFAGKKIMGGRSDESDQPLLNRRGDQLIGRTATLTEPIADGRGRVKIGDTMWRVSGPDLPAGAKVRVKAATDLDLELVVEPADSGEAGLIFSAADGSALRTDCSGRRRSSAGRGSGRCRPACRPRPRPAR